MRHLTYKTSGFSTSATVLHVENNNSTSWLSLTRRYWSRAAPTGTGFQNLRMTVSKPTWNDNNQWRVKNRCVAVMCLKPKVLIVLGQEKQENRQTMCKSMLLCPQLCLWHLTFCSSWCLHKINKQTSQGRTRVKILFSFGAHDYWGVSLSAYCVEGRAHSDQTATRLQFHNICKHTDYCWLTAANLIMTAHTGLSPLPTMVLFWCWLNQVDIPLITNNHAHSIT